LAPTLPIDAILPELIDALTRDRQAVLQAPPGAGKTTRVPLALMQSGLSKGRILMLEPRRLATRAAAARMSETLGEPLGKTVGYRIRGESKTGPQTKIEVVTEGILTRMIQRDPELSDIGAVIFDEFHERSLQADLGLALCLDLREALREDLMLVVMSATFDASPVADLMGGAPVISSEGRAFEVETRWLARPWNGTRGAKPRVEVAMADLITQALNETEGDILAFLPGEGEIRRVQARLGGNLTGDVTGKVAGKVELHPLFGALDFKAQRAAIETRNKGRKIVLATSIAETSLTIEGIRTVVDAGLARRARFDPGSGMSRLVTERASKAEADQRRGRAGRVASGVCYRLWTKGEEGGMARFAPAEIEIADLAPLVLEAALWGVTDASTLRLLTRPRGAALQGAATLLKSLGALDRTGAITAHGRKLAALPLHPRLGHLVMRGGNDAPWLAGLLAERDVLSSPGRGRAPSDLTLRLRAAKNPVGFEQDHPWYVNRTTLARIKKDVKRLKSGGKDDLSVGEMAALAFPDRIGLRRKGEAARYILSGGKGAICADNDPLGQSRLIVACDLDGDPKEAKIRLAAPLSESGFRRLFGPQIIQRDLCEWSRRERVVVTRRQEVFGALILNETPWKGCPEDRIAEAMCAGIRDMGFDALNLPKSALNLIARLNWVRAQGADLPDFSPSALLKTLEDWLGPRLGKCRRISDLENVGISAALLERLDWPARQTLERLAPKSIIAPTGSTLTIDYGGDTPKISVRLQEMFGLTRHPCIGPANVPLLIELLSPAHRPVQLTADLPGFWRTSYGDVRKDMRGRYPKHHWPEDPANAAATRRRKPR